MYIDMYMYLHTHQFAPLYPYIYIIEKQIMYLFLFTYTFIHIYILIYVIIWDMFYFLRFEGWKIKAFHFRLASVLQAQEAQEETQLRRTSVVCKGVVNKPLGCRCQSFPAYVFTFG